MYPNQVNIIHKKNYKKTSFTPNIELIKSDYFAPYNNTKRVYFQTFPLQTRNALRKQYEKYMNQKKLLFLFSIGFSKLKNKENKL